MLKNLKKLFTAIFFEKNLAIAFTLLFISDSLSKIGEVLSLPIVNTALVFKVIFQFFLFFYIVKTADRVTLKIFLNIILLFLIFIIGHVFMTSKELIWIRIFKNLKNFNWYIYIFILQAAISTFLLKSNFKKELKALFKVFEKIFYINCICILVGILFNLEIFKAYFHTGRFGFNGLLRNATHASFIFIIFILYFHYKVKKEKTLKSKFQLSIALFICLALTTKAVLLFILIYSFYSIIIFKKYYYLTIPILFISSIIIWFDDFMELFVKRYSPILFDVYKNDGLVTMLFSFRDKAITEKFLPYIQDNWTFGNYIFGGAEFNLQRTEFELLDLYWLFGVGLIIYLYSFSKFIISFKLIWNEFPILIMITIIFLAGSFFSSAPVTAFLLVFILFYKYNYEKIVERNLLL